MIPPRTQATHMPKPAPLIPRRPGLAFWIMLGTLGSAITTLLLLLILVEDFFADYAQQRAQSDVYRLANQMTHAVDFQLNERLDDLLLLAHWSLFREQSADQQRRVLATLAHESDDYSWLLITSPQGIIRVASLSSIEGLHIPADPWYPPRFQRPSISDIHPEAPPKINASPSHLQLTMHYEIAVPLNNHQGLLDGWLIASLPATRIEQMARRLLQDKSAPTQADLMMFRNDGAVFFSSHDASIRKIPDAIRLDLQAGKTVKLQWPDRQWYFTSVQQLPRHAQIQYPDWYILVRQPVSVAMHDFSNLQDRITLSAILAFCALSLLTYFMSRRLCAPLVALRQALENPGCIAIPQSNSYAEVILLSRVLAEMRHLEQLDLQVLAELNQTLEAQVTARTQELDNVLQHAMNAFISLNERGEVIDWNLQASRLLGWQKAEMLGQPIPEALLSPQQRDWLQQQLQLHAETGAIPLLKDQRITELFHRHGEAIAVEVHSWISETALGFRLNIIIQDVRERLTIERDLRESQQRLQTITDNLPVLIAYIDRHLRYQFNNATYGLWYGWTMEELKDRPVRELFPAEEYMFFLPFMEQALRGEVQRFERSEQRADGVHYLYSIYIPHRREQEVVGFYVLSQDITPRKQLELELKRHALNDPLTGLPNRRSLMEQLPKAMARSSRTEQMMALLFMDLDGFKAINDNFGHDAGDELLQQFAQRIQSHLRETDTLFRLAGDEFTLILENLQHGEPDARLKAQQLLEAMADPFVLTTATVRLSSSIGIACYAPHAEVSAETLLGDADQAMYRAKRTGKNQFVVAQPE